MEGTERPAAALLNELRQALCRKPFTEGFIEITNGVPTRPEQVRRIQVFGEAVLRHAAYLVQVRAPDKEGSSVAECIIPGVPGGLHNIGKHALLFGPSPFPQEVVLHGIGIG